MDLWDNAKGEFAKKKYEKYLIHMMKCFNVNGWIEHITADNNELNKLLKCKKKTISQIKSKLISKTNRNKLLSFIKKLKMPALVSLLSNTQFENQLTLFIHDCLSVYNTNNCLHNTEIIHKVLFNGNENDYRCIKVLVDTAWSCCK